MHITHTKKVWEGIMNKGEETRKKQVEDIKYIQSTVGLEYLGPRYMGIAKARLLMPDASYEKLSLYCNPSADRGTVYRYLKYISSVADLLRSKAS